MGSTLGNWPSFDPHNFSQLRPSDPSNPSKMIPATYHPTHDRTLPPPDQGLSLHFHQTVFQNADGLSVKNFNYDLKKVISTETKNILLRHFYQRAEEKLRPKRAASEHLTPEHGCKQPRASAAD